MQTQHLFFKRIFDITLQNIKFKEIILIKQIYISKTYSQKKLFNISDPSGNLSAIEYHKIDDKLQTYYRICQKMNLSIIILGFDQQRLYLLNQLYGKCLLTIEQRFKLKNLATICLNMGEYLKAMIFLNNQISKIKKYTQKRYNQIQSKGTLFQIQENRGFTFGLQFRILVLIFKIRNINYKW
ncbi:hypothetical protein pb186bvf_006441 [Paramecium bursaria]